MSLDTKQAEVARRPTSCSLHCGGLANTVSRWIEIPVEGRALFKGKPAAPDVKLLSFPDASAVRAELEVRRKNDRNSAA